jgi:hypothetical protein
MTDAMNKSDATSYLLREQARKTQRLAQTLDLVETLPDSLDIDAIEIGRVYLPNATYAENMETLHNLRKNHKLELDSYYLSGYQQKVLALCYAADKDEDGNNAFLLHMYCTDLDNALQHVGQGRCKVVEVVESYTQQKVVCDM